MCTPNTIKYSIFQSGVQNRNAISYIVSELWPEARDHPLVIDEAFAKAQWSTRWLAHLRGGWPARALKERHGKRAQADPQPYS